jgi:hypothetical protein
MKKKFIILMILITYSTISFAQRLKPNEVIKAKTISFRSNQDRYGNLIVFDSKNDYFSKKSKTASANISTVKRKEKAMLTSFLQVFSNERLSQLVPERYLSMVCFVDTSGKVLAITFYLKKNTLVTAQELEELQQSIKTNVSFRLNPEETKGGDFFPIAQIVVYDQVLKRTLK